MPDNAAGVFDRIASAVRRLALVGSAVAAAGTAVAAAAPPAGKAETTAIAVELAHASATGGHADLAAQADRLALLAPDMLVPCLAAFTDATPAGANWLRSALDRAVERLGAAVPLDELATVAADTTRPARGRSLAFGWLRDRDAARADTMLEGMCDDPALDLRREAVERLLGSAATADDAAQREVHRRGLKAARDLDQIERIAEWLGAHGEPIDVADVLGFVRSWRVSEAFDNVGGAGFATAYPPEADERAMPAADGWKPVRSSDKHGTIDLNAAIAKKKGVLAYAVAAVDMPDGRRAQVRIGSPCAVAVWVNGVPAMSHEIYHASEAVDQYVAESDFRAGTNVVLVKCCQNEQTEAWAADWKFQLRICDPLGTPLGTQATAGAGAATEEP
jgi:hypothetical protein